MFWRIRDLMALLFAVWLVFVSIVVIISVIDWLLSLSLWLMVVIISGLVIPMMLLCYYRDEIDG